MMLSLTSRGKQEALQFPNGSPPQRALSYLEMKQQASSGELINQMGLPPEQGKKILRKMVSQGLIRRANQEEA